MKNNIIMLVENEKYYAGCKWKIAYYAGWKWKITLFWLKMKYQPTCIFWNSLDLFEVN